MVTWEHVHPDVHRWMGEPVFGLLAEGQCDTCDAHVQSVVADIRARSTLTLLSRVAFWASLEGFARRAESPQADRDGFSIGVLRHIVFVGALDGAHGEVIRLSWGGGS